MELTSDERRRVGDLHTAIARVILDSEDVPAVAICATLLHLAGACVNAMASGGERSERYDLEWAKGALERSVDCTRDGIAAAVELVEASEATKN